MVTPFLRGWVVPSLLLLPHKGGPAVVERWEEEGEQFAPDGVFLHLFVETVLFHTLYTFAQGAEFTGFFRAAPKDGFGVLNGVVVLLVFN